MRIYIIGYMGAGKSTVSVRLARKLGFERFDLDELFELRYKVSVHDFFQKYGQELFRKFESQLLKETVSIDNAVISCGGGTPCFYDNMYWMNQHGLTVYLKLSHQAIHSRLILSKKKRPLIAKKNPEELFLFIRNHLRQRNIYYSQAKITVTGESLNMDQLLKLIKEYQR